MQVSVKMRWDDDWVYLGMEDTERLEELVGTLWDVGLALVVEGQDAQMVRLDGGFVWDGVSLFYELVPEIVN